VTENDFENGVNVLQLKVIAAYEKICPLKRAKLNQSTPYWIWQDFARWLGGHRTTVIPILWLIARL
jgi:hypothetical protein